MDKKKKFKVYDLTEYKETLGYADNMRGIKKLAKEQIDATDGDCCIFYAELNKETDKYKFSERIFLETI